MSTTTDRRQSMTALAQLPEASDELKRQNKYAHPIPKTDHGEVGTQLQMHVTYVFKFEPCKQSCVVFMIINNKNSENDDAKDSNNDTNNNDNYHSRLHWLIRHFVKEPKTKYIYIYLRR